MLAASHQHMDDKLLVIPRAARICRQDLFTSEPMFQGIFPEGCSTVTSSKSLLILFHMILRGPDIKGELKDDARSQSIHVIVQLIKYNSVNYSHANATRTRHNIERETALPTYIGLMIYSINKYIVEILYMSRNTKAVSKLHEVGVCISYDRILQIYKNIDNQVWDKYNEERLVYPLSLPSGVFSTLQFDNINKQCSSTTAKSDFNGPGFSVAYHVTEENSGKYRVLPTITQNVKTFKTLPHSYTAIEPANLMAAILD